MNIQITYKTKKVSYGKVMYFYFRGGFARILFWPWVRRSIYINKDEIIEISIHKKRVFDETNSTIQVI